MYLISKFGKSCKVCVQLINTKSKLQGIKKPKVVNVIYLSVEDLFFSFFLPREN